MRNGVVRVTVPSGWTAPNTTSGTAGYTVASTGTVGVAGQVVTVTGVTLQSAGTMTITYGSGAGGGVTVTSTTGTATFTAAQAATSAGTVTSLAASPTVTVRAPDGSGTMTVNRTNVSAGATSQSLSFTYTAATGGISGGALRLLAPTNWTAPAGGNATIAFSGTGAGTLGFSGQQIDVTSLTMTAGETLTISYGAVTVPAVGTGATWTTSESSSRQPGRARRARELTGVTVRAADGSGTMTVNKTDVSAGATSQTLTFTYTAASGGITAGSLRMVAATNWAAPVGGNTTIAFSGTGTGTLGFSGQQINVTNLNMTAGETMTVTYGPVTVPAVGTAAAWATSEFSSVVPGTPLVALASSPNVNVRATDGSGTMTVDKSDVSAGATSQTLTFTYTAAAGGIQGGALRLLAPAGWTAPVGGNTTKAFSGTGTGTLAFSGQQINLTRLNMSAGETLTITYGAVTVPAVGTSASWATSENSSANPGTLVAIGTSPTVNVRAADGSGTMTVDKTDVSSGATSQTLTFTYTAPAGGIQGGAVQLAAPAGWTAPIGGNTTKAFSGTGTATLAFSGQNINLTGLNMTAAETLTITYGAVTVPAVGTGATWTTKENSSANPGTLVAIGTSPTVTVHAADGTGTMTVDKTDVSSGATSQTLTFTYTAPAGGIQGGALRLLAPAGWTAPVGGNTTKAFSGTGTGTLAFSGQQINLTSLNMSAGETLTITYGAVTIPAVGTGAAWTTTENSSANPGTLVAIGTSPTVNVHAADGTGTMTVDKSDVSAGATSQTLTFTYTAAAGGIQGGALRLLAPAGWTAPVGGNTTKAFSGTGTGTLAFSGQQINLTSLNMSAGETLTITYGAVTIPAVGTGASLDDHRELEPQPRHPRRDRHLADGERPCRGRRWDDDGRQERRLRRRDLADADLHLHGRGGWDPGRRTPPPRPRRLDRPGRRQHHQGLLRHRHRHPRLLRPADQPHLAQHERRRDAHHHLRRRHHPRRRHQRVTGRPPRTPPPTPAPSSQSAPPPPSPSMPPTAPGQ